MNEVLLVAQFASPVALAALGETVGQRAGILNIGLEGSMLAGAYFALVGVAATGSPWIGLLFGIAAGLTLTMIVSYLAIDRGADQVVTGTAATLLAIGVTGTLFRARYGASGQLLSLPKLETWIGIDPVLAFGALAAAGVWFLLARTSWGLALRACGEYPAAAEASGFSVRRIRYAASALCGSFAGLGGAYLTLGVVGSFAENMTAGRGFVAIAMVTFGRWNPVLVYGSCLLIGWLDSLQFAVQSKGWNIPYQLLIAAPYAVALLVLVFVGKGGLGPAALARPFTRP